MSSSLSVVIAPFLNPPLPTVVVVPFSESPYFLLVPNSYVPACVLGRPEVITYGPVASRLDVVEKKFGRNRVNSGLSVGLQAQKMVAWASIVDHSSTSVVSSTQISFENRKILMFKWEESYM